MQIRAGVDWLSLTRVDGPGAWEWAMKGIHAVNTIADEGNEVKARNLQGYQGVGCGGSFVGTRHDGYLVQVSGKHADIWFDELYDSECHVTRIDMQVTVQYDTYDDKIGEMCYDSSVMYAQSLPEPRRWKQYFIRGSDGGYSAYIGANSAKQRACIYNKDRESREEDYQRCWRYEVRFRDELADKWSKMVNNAATSRELFILDSVNSWLISRGIYRFELGAVGETVMPKISTRSTDVETKLRWFREQVRPSVQWLADRVDRGVILEALGVTEPPNTP